MANSAWAMLDADTSRYFRYIDPSLLCGAGLQRCRGGPPASNALLGGRPTLQPRYGPVPSQLRRRGTTEHLLAGPLSPVVFVPGCLLAGAR